MLPILFINLDSDTERRQRMELQLGLAGLPGTRFQATRWTELASAEQASFYSQALNDRQFHKPLVNGEKGCYASHLRVWQHLVSSDHPALVVLEDDVVIKPNFAALLAAIAALPCDWDMIKLLGRQELHAAEKISSGTALTPQYGLVGYRRVPSLTAGYVISRQGAQKLLDSRFPFGRPVDVDLRHWWESDLRILGVMPSAIGLDETSLQSSIGAAAPEVSLVARWRKFRLKAKYSLLNLRHRS